MSCFCLGDKARTERSEAGHQAHVGDFYKLMLGNYDANTLGRVCDDQLERSAEEFERINPSQSLNDIASIVSKNKSSGLVYSLAPILHDHIRRKSSLSAVASALASLPGPLSKEFSNISGRDLFIALALSCSDTVRLYNIASTIPGMALPLVVPGPGDSTITLWDAFSDILALPRSSLVVSIGTVNSRRMGKTTLLQQSGLCGSLVNNVSSPSSTSIANGLSVNKCCADFGRLGSPSIDLYISPNQLALFTTATSAADSLSPLAASIGVLADCSGFNVFESPAVESLVSSASLTIVHVFPSDVSDKSGPSQELKDLLSYPSKFGVMMVILIRDSESWKPNCRALLNAILEVFKNNIAIKVDVHNYLKSSVDKTAIYRSVYNNVKSVFPAKFLKDKYCPSLSVLKEGGLASITAGGVSSGGNPLLSLPNTTGGGMNQVFDICSNVSKELLVLLEEGNSSGRVSTKVFPFSTASTRLMQLKKDERRVREDGASDCETSLTLIAKERGSWNAFLANSQPSQLIQWFCRKIVEYGKGAHSRWSIARLANEVNECVSLWKLPLMEPLVKLERDQMDVGDMKSAAETHAKIEELNISIDSFWTELEVLISPESPWEQPGGVLEADVDLIHQAFAFSVLAGAPVQLLKGSPLRLTETSFLKAILTLKNSATGSSSEILVISVIGAQSSAKSTLLNFLFGCNFVTRAGRCTRGLYGSFLRLQDGRLLIVLDTEGLLSLENSCCPDALAASSDSNGDIFDGQMTLLAMACSQLVLINHKGEVSRQLQDLLEVCMFALKHLRVTNFQPDIFFVLRDQHDRSPTVHEDMLRQMKRHLGGCANRLGLKLEDVLRLNASSIFLLPSAYSTQIHPSTNSDVSVINEVFSDEIVKLRKSVLGVLSESAKRQTEAWVSLDQWYTHCHTVWETLVQFGHNLLHYKTIREVELKRELAQIGNEVSKQVLESGFKPEATKFLQEYVENRLKVVSEGISSVEDLDTADVELRAGLSKIRELWVDKLMAAFAKQIQNSEKFTATMKEEVGSKLPAVLDYVYDNLMYTWKLHLKQSKDAQQAGSMWAHFCEVLDKALFSDPTKMAVITESEARALFAREWAQYEVEFLNRLDSVKKSRSAIAYEVSVLFNTALAKVRLEKPDYQLLKEQSAQILLQGHVLMNDKSDDMWRMKYVNVGGAATVSSEDVTRDVRQLRKLVLDLCSDVDSEVLRSGGGGQLVNESIVATEWLRSAHDIAYRDGDRRMKVAKVRQPQVLADLNLDLRVTLFTALCRSEEARHAKQIDNLLKQKREIEDHLVTMAKGNAGDLDRAASFADRYFKQIDQWLDRQVTSFAAEVRATVLSEMPDPAKAHERAFQQSFGARNWIDVLEYCLDVNAYLEKMFLTLFYRRQAAVIATRLPELEQRLRDMFGVLREMVALWQKEVSAGGGISGKKAMFSGNAKRIFDLRDFAKRLGNTDGLMNYAVVVSVVEIFPATVNFEIRDVRLFAEAFREQILTKMALYGPESRSPLFSPSGRVLASLQEQSVQAWSLIRGCTSRCPLCGSKCDCLGDHAKHSCSHHLFPAFHGWMDRASGAPSLAFCKSEDVYAGTYQCRDAEWRSLVDYLSDSHPSWVPFPRGGDVTASSADVDEDVTVLRAAWVNCKFALEKYFTPMKASNPAQWECYVEVGRQLTANDLDGAKKTIRAIRAKTWTPQITPAMQELVEGVAASRGDPVGGKKFGAREQPILSEIQRAA